MGHFPTGTGGIGTVTEIVSPDDSVTVTNPFGPTVDLTNAGDSGAAAPYVNVQESPYNATGNGVVLLNGSMTLGAPNTLTCPSNPFNPLTDVGKLLVVMGAGAAGVPLVTTIAAVGSAGSVTTTDAASTAVAAHEFTFGTDDTVALQAAYNAAPLGGEVFHPRGVYLTTADLTVPNNGITLTGTGMDFTAPGTAGTLGGIVPRTGSIVRAASASVINLVNFGTVTNKTTPGASSRSLSFDASLLAANAAKFTASRSTHRLSCYVRGATQSIWWLGQDVSLIDSVVASNTATADAILLDGTTSATCFDNRIINNTIRQCDNGIHAVGNISDILIVHNHFYASNAGNNILLQCSGGLIHIADNLIEDTVNDYVLIQPPAASNLRVVNIEDNLFFTTLATFGTTFSGVNIDTVTNAGSSVTTVNMSGNNFEGKPPAVSTNYFLNMLRIPTPATVSGVNFENNQGYLVANFFGGQRPDGDVSGCSLVPPSGGSVQFSDRDGVTTFSGNGTTTAFAFTHRLAGTPRYALAVPSSAPAASVAAAPNSFYLTVDGTNITVNFTVAPGVGTNNVTLWWQAGL